MPADNTRFGASGGVTSNDISWGIDRLWFCEPIVFPPPAPSRLSVSRQRRERCRESSTFREESTIRQRCKAIDKNERVII